MVTKMRKLNAGGFSLVELMVVVAIIGILASVAIPNFQRFQRKARQSEGRGLSASVKTGLEAFTAEWDSYSGDMVTLGLRLTGALNYRCEIGDFDPAAFYTGVPAYVAGQNSTGIAAVRATGGATETARAVAPTAAPATTRTTYTISCAGDLGGPSGADDWSVDHTGAVTIVNEGTL